MAAPRTESPGTRPLTAGRPSRPGLGIRLERVGVSFPIAGGRLEALADCSLDAEPGSFTAIIGPNGCGKSTLLRVVAGLLAPDGGRVMLGEGADAAPPRAGDARVGLVFQQPRLVPWLSTLDNVALPLALAGTPPRERRDRAAAALARVGLEAAARLRPSELSGGMAQRAALARALIDDPPILLLDEPFSALDALTREVFDAELQRLWMALPRTVLLVTHSVSEATRLADRIAVMTARPGTMARVVDVDLPRPRAAELAGDRAAAEVAGTVRETLAAVHPPELAPWVEA